MWMVGWHHRLNGYEFEQIPGDGEGQGSLACCSPWGRKESDITSEYLSPQIFFFNDTAVECFFFFFSKKAFLVHLYHPWISHVWTHLQVLRQLSVNVDTAAFLFHFFTKSLSIVISLFSWESRKIKNTFKMIATIIQNINVEYNCRHFSRHIWLWFQFFSRFQHNNIMPTKYEHFGI